nr:MAG TPA: hypothetical protein [Caudoviricetes sp.]
MAYTPYGWQNPYYAQPMPDNLAQLRQQQMPPMMAPQPPQNPMAQNGVQWVSGEQEARNWMIAPNAAVALWDSTAPTVYLKQADASGKPSLKIYDLVERSQTPPASPQAKAADFVTREEFDRLAAIVGEIRGNEKPAKKVKEADADG